MSVTFIECILLFAAHAAAGIYASTLKYSKKTVYIIWGIWVAVQSGLLFYAESSMGNPALQFFAGFILPLIGQYVIFFLTTKGRPAKRIFTMLTYSLFFCISIAFFNMVKGSFGELHPIFAVFLQGVTLAAIVAYFLGYVCPLCRIAAKNITSGWIPLIFVNVVFLITVVLSSAFPVRLTSFGDPTFYTFLFLSVSIMAVYPVIFSSISSMAEAAEKKAVETQNKLLLAQIEAESIQLAADRQARHDRRHHNLVMLEFANNNDIESVRAYLSGLVENDSQVWGEVRHCENMTVNTVLTAYERKAMENGISVKISARAGRDLPVLPQDLVIVIANLFENAIHAAAKLKENDRSIHIDIKDSTQRLLIKVENPCKGNLVFDESLYGIGIRSVIATANKYDGMYDFAAEEGRFSAKISLNLR